MAKQAVTLLNLGRNLSCGASKGHVNVTTDPKHLCDYARSSPESGSGRALRRELLALKPPQAHESEPSTGDLDRSQTEVTEILTSN